MLSADSLGIQGNGTTSDISFSPDGTKILLRSAASNLTPGDTNGTWDIFLKDLTTSAVSLVSSNSYGIQANHDVDDARFSPDGTKILFSSTASNLVNGDTNGTSDIFIKDLITGTVTRVSTDSAGVEGNGYSDNAHFSPDGTKVVFRSLASGLVTGDTNAVRDSFVKDLVTGEITRISTDLFGNQANAESLRPVFSPDGTKIVFDSFASNLVTSDTNGHQDVFVVTLNLPAGIYGTGLADVLNGTDSNEIIYGFQGNDTIYGSSGDSVYGGAGVDTLVIDAGDGHGGDGDDLIFGSKTDEDTGNSSWSKLYGDDGNDTIGGGTYVEGGNGNDNIHTEGWSYALVYGNSGNDVIHVYGTGYGGTGNDTITGGSRDSNFSNTLYGEDGDDVISSDAGYLDGGEGNDTLTGGIFDFTQFYGGGGDDLIEDFGYNNYLNGGTGNDTLYGNDGDDYIIGYDPLEKSLKPVGYESPEMTLVPTLGRDEANYLFGGNGNDTIDNGAAGGELHGGEGDDILTGYAHAAGYRYDGSPASTMASMFGDGGNDYILNGLYMDGGDGDDKIENGGDQSSIIYAGSGHDVVWASGEIHGGSGDDQLTGQFYRYRSSRESEMRYAEWNDIYGDEGNDTITSRTGNLDGGLGDDILILTGSDNYDFPFAGSTISGGAGNDWIEAYVVHVNSTIWGTQGDGIDAGSGDDTVLVHTRANIDVGEGNDIIRLFSVYGPELGETSNAFTGETITFGASEATVGSWIDGGAGYDVVEMIDFRVFTAANFADGFELANVERLVGNTQDNIINLTWLPVGDINVQGLGGHDIIWSNIGNDTLEGGAGNDIIRGFAGNDTIFGGEGNDFIGADDGNDTVFGDAGNDDIRGGYGDDLLYGGEGDDRLKGNESNDSLYGDSGNDKLYGSAGDDLLNGGDGIDELYGEDGSDTLYGGTGNDKLSGAAGIDRLNGGLGADKLYGGEGDDQLKGNEDNDTLYGDNGNDKLYGGTGDDIFNGGDGVDELYGEDGNDKMLGGAGADKLSGGNGNDRLTGGEGGDSLWGGTGADQFVFDTASLSARDIVKDFSMAQGDKLELNNILTGYDPLTSAIADFVKITESSGKSYLSVDANGATGGAFFIQIAQIDGATGMTNVDQLLKDHVLIVTNSAVV